MMKRHLSLLPLGIGGSILFLSYVRSIGSTYSGLPIILAYIGTSLLSISIIYYLKTIKSDKRAIPLFLFTLYILTLTLILLWSVRFEALSGTDNLFEYRSARDTMNEGHWPIERADDNHMFVSLSISVFPAIYSIIAGMDLMFVFKFVLPMIISIVPILVFLVVREVFDDVTIAGISSILLAENVVFFYNNSLLIRMQLGILFFLSVLYLVFRGDRLEPIKSRVLCIIFMAGIVFSHYSLIYFTIPFFLIYILSPNFFSVLPKRMVGILRVKLDDMQLIHRHITREIVLFFIILSFSWFLFFGTDLFKYHVFAVNEYILPFIFGGGTFNVQTTYSTQSPMGIIYSIWNYMVMLFSGVGLLISWFKKDKDLKKGLWSLGASYFMLLIPLWMITPNLSNLAGIVRIFGLSLLLIFSFAALILVEIDKKLKGIFLIIFLSINLPLNVFLVPNTVFFQPKNSLSPEQSAEQIYNTMQGLSLAIWINNHVPPSEPINGDNRLKDEMFYARSYTERKKERGFLEVKYPHYSKASYLVLHDYYVENNVWVIWNSTLGRYSDTLNQTIRNSIPRSNIIFNNGYVLLQKFD